jgi:hypothetical protein
MIPGRFLSRQAWQAKLRRWHCEPLAGKGRLNTAEWWIGPDRRPFTVPVENDGRCDFWAIQKICREFGLPPLEDDPPLD